MKNIMVSTILCLTLVALLSACSPQASPQISAPTMDISVIRTEVAAAIQAEYTKEAINQHTVEPTQDITQTPYVITATFEPTPTAPIVVASFTPVKASASSNVAAPTKIPAPALLVSQTPYYGTNFRPGESFDAVFTFKNTSSRVWNTKYYIRAVGGDLSPGQTPVMIGGNVEIGASTTFTVDYTAPGDGGKHTTNWELVDDNGAAILSFILVINVE